MTKSFVLRIKGKIRRLFDRYRRLAQYKKFSPVLLETLRERGLKPILLDVGASGEPPELWEPISSESVYVGLDPDSREMRDTGGIFSKKVIINRALSEKNEENEILFYLTKSPYCSSTLQPMTKELEKYDFHDLFTVVGKTVVPAISFSEILESYNLSRIDWLKLDTQGCDLRLYRSIPLKYRSEILVVDLEPGLMKAYQGEDFFADVDSLMREEGFWLSDLSVRGTQRISRKSLESSVGQKLKNKGDLERIRISPGWVGARYLRDLDWLKSKDSPIDRYILLWVFGILERQYGFCLDICLELKNHLEGFNYWQKLYDETRKLIYKI